jgi:Stage II sporulation protein E (SpoIIE)
LGEGGGWPRKSPDIPATERDTSQSLIWDVLTRNLTWRFRVAEAQERERIEQELQVSRRIQQASLPEEVPKLEGWQISPLYQPAREVGGDFYDFHLLSEGRLGVVVGDATGKGVPAALVMSTTLGMLRLAAQSYSSPGQMLQRVNEALFPYIPPTRSLPASTPSSIQRVGYCATPTPVMTCLTYIMMARPKNLGPEGCP